MHMAPSGEGKTHIGDAPPRPTGKFRLDVTIPIGSPAPSRHPSEKTHLLPSTPPTPKQPDTRKDGCGIAPSPVTHIWKRCFLLAGGNVERARARRGPEAVWCVRPAVQED